MRIDETVFTSSHRTQIRINPSHIAKSDLRRATLAASRYSLFNCVDSCVEGLVCLPSCLMDYSDCLFWYVIFDSGTWAT